jgi:hypothetical protein
MTLFGIQIAGAQSPESTTAALLSRLMEEVRSLRVELAEARLDRHVERIRLLQQETDSLRNMRAKLDAEARAQEDDLRQFRNQLQTSEFNDAERAVIESSKAEASAEAAARISRERLTAEQSEAAAQQGLAREKDEHRKLSERLALLRGPR